MNITKIISFTAFLFVVFSFYQCGNTDQAATTTANAATSAAAKTVNAITPNTSGSTVAVSVVKGNFTNAANLKIFIEEAGFNNSNRIIGKADIDGSGNFETPISEEMNAGVYRFRVGAQKNYFFLDKGAKTVNISGDMTQINAFGYTVDDSDATNEFTTIMKDFIAQRPTTQQAKTKLMTARSPLVGLFGASLVFPAAGGLETIKTKLEIQNAALARLSGTNSPQVQAFKKTIQAEQAQVAAQLAQQKIKVGEMAPNITLQSPDGKSYSLSDLKGKVVLLDFWASWCGPCRRENPNVVKTYKQYNKKGFEVFSVSLDGIHPKVRPRLKTQEQIDQQMTSAKSKWQDAISKDQLQWPYHVSDLQHWGSPVAKSYGVSSIPKTFLIDKDGKIAAINPRGAALEPAIKKLL